MSQTKKKKKSNKKKKKVVKNTDSNFFSSTLFLSIVFVSLLILVIFLVVLVHNKKEKMVQDKVNIIIPIYKTDSDFDFSISAAELKNSKQYVFKVVNYMKDIVNDEDVTYTVTISNPTKSVITLTKNDSVDNLMVKQKETILENEVLHSGEEDENYYYVRYEKIAKMKETDLINIHIKS